MQPEIRIYSVYNGIQCRILLYTINKNENVMEDLWGSRLLWQLHNQAFNRNFEHGNESVMMRLIYSNDHRIVGASHFLKSHYSDEYYSDDEYSRDPVDYTDTTCLGVPRGCR
jgi:hypothetical protein